MLKAKIVISERNQTVITRIKHFIKRILHRSRYNPKMSTNLNLNIDKERTFVTKIKSKAFLKKKIFISAANGFFYLENTDFSYQSKHFPGFQNHT